MTTNSTDGLMRVDQSTAITLVTWRGSRQIGLGLVFDKNANELKQTSYVASLNQCMAELADRVGMACAKLFPGGQRINRSAAQPLLSCCSTPQALLNHCSAAAQLLRHGIVLDPHQLRVHPPPCLFCRAILDDLARLGFHFRGICAFIDEEAGSFASAPGVTRGSMYCRALTAGLQGMHAEGGGEGPGLPQLLGIGRGLRLSFERSQWACTVRVCEVWVHGQLRLTFSGPRFPLLICLLSSVRLRFMDAAVITLPS